MSDDLVKRLRDISPIWPVGDDLRLVWEEAADRIEALEAQKAEEMAAELMRQNPRLAEAWKDGTIAGLQERIEALEAENAQLRGVLDRAQAAIWDAHYGKGIAVEYARKVDAEIREALTASSGEPSAVGEAERRVIDALAPCFDREQGKPRSREITAKIPARLWNKVRDAYWAAQRQESDGE